MYMEEWKLICKWNANLQAGAESREYIDYIQQLRHSYLNIEKAPSLPAMTGSRTTHIMAAANPRIQGKQLQVYKCVNTIVSCQPANTEDDCVIQLFLRDAPPETQPTQAKICCACTSVCLHPTDEAVVYTQLHLSGKPTVHTDQMNPGLHLMIQED